MTDKPYVNPHDVAYYGQEETEKRANEKAMQDSGERINYGEGRAIRQPTTGKGRFDLIAPEMLFRLSKWLQKGAEKYAPRNWELGIPISRCVDSAMRHLTQYLDGQNDEDHISACLCNLMFITYYEEHLPEMQDLPTWKVVKDAETNISN